MGQLLHAIFYPISVGVLVLGVWALKTVNFTQSFRVCEQFYGRSAVKICIH